MFPISKSSQRNMTLTLSSMSSWETWSFSSRFKPEKHYELLLSSCCQLKRDSLFVHLDLSSQAAGLMRSCKTAPSKKSEKWWAWICLFMLSSGGLIFQRDISFFNDYVKSQQCRTVFKWIAGSSKWTVKETILFTIMIFTELAYNFMHWPKHEKIRFLI